VRTTIVPNLSADTRLRKIEVTYNDPRDSDTKNKTIRSQYPDSILSLDDPLGNSNLVFPLLRSIGVSVLCQVLSCDLVGECLVGFCKIDIFRFSFLFRLVIGELDFVRVATLSALVEYKSTERHTIVARVSCNVS
jgi:hypothetical protein